MLTVKLSKLYTKSLKNKNKQVLKKLSEFIEFKTNNPLEAFGSSDTAFNNSGNLRGYRHAHLNSDISVCYKIEKDTLYLFGIFSHDELGTGQPPSVSTQKTLSTKFTNQVFENKNNMAIVKMMTSQFSNMPIDLKIVDVKYLKSRNSAAKQCFNNSFKKMSFDKNDRYVLGFVFFHNIPIEHAWIKTAGVYYDVTIDPAEQDGYISVAEFSATEIAAYVEKYKSAPALYEMNRFLNTNSNK